MITIHTIDLHNPGHYNHLLTLLDEYASHPTGGGKGLSKYTQQHLLSRLQQRNDYFGLLAFDIDRPVGLLNAFEGFSTFNAKPLLNIHDIVVTSSHRNRGVAQSLLQQTELVALQRGYCKLTLEVLSNNQQAQKAYQKFGFNRYALSEEFGHALFWEKLLPTS